MQASEPFVASLYSYVKSWLVEVISVCCGGLDKWREWRREEQVITGSDSRGVRLRR